MYGEKERRRESFLEQQTQWLQDARERGMTNNKKNQTRIIAYLRVT